MKVVEVITKLLLKLLSVFCLMMFLSGIFMLLDKTDGFREIGIFFCLFFGTLSYLFLKKRKKTIDNSLQLNADKIESFNLETPKEILHDMKKHFPQSQISLVVQQIEDSYKIMCSTSDIETLISRHEFGIRKCYTLKQLEQCGLYSGNLSSDYYLSLYKANYHDLIIKCYEQYYKKAKKQLKTEKGVQKKIDAFWAYVAEELNEFTIQELKDRVNQRW